MSRCPGFVGFGKKVKALWPAPKFPHSPLRTISAKGANLFLKQEEDNPLRQWPEPLPTISKIIAAEAPCSWIFVGTSLLLEVVSGLLAISSWIRWERWTGWAASEDSKKPEPQRKRPAGSEEASA